MFQVAAEDAKDARRFFQSDLGFEAKREDEPTDEERVPGRHKSSDRLATVDFYAFYQLAIKDRVQKKLEEEEERKLLGCYQTTVPAVTINLNDDESHPPVLSADEPQTQPEQGSPPRKLPRRRGGPTDLSKIA